MHTVIWMQNVDGKETEPFQMSEEAQKIKWTDKIKNEKFYMSKGEQH